MPVRGHEPVDRTLEIFLCGCLTSTGRGGKNKRSAGGRPLDRVGVPSKAKALGLCLIDSGGPTPGSVSAPSRRADSFCARSVALEMLSLYIETQGRQLTVSGGTARLKLFKHPSKLSEDRDPDPPDCCDSQESSGQVGHRIEEQESAGAEGILYRELPGRRSRSPCYQAARSHGHEGHEGSHWIVRFRTLAHSSILAEHWATAQFKLPFDGITFRNGSSSDSGRPIKSCRSPLAELLE